MYKAVMNLDRGQAELTKLKEVPKWMPELRLDEVKAVVSYGNTIELYGTEQGVQAAVTKWRLPWK